MSAPCAKPRVLIIYQYIALYRLPVFAELARSDVFEFTFMSGLFGPGETPKLATRDELNAGQFKWVEARNVWLPKGLLWQPEAIEAALGDRYDAIIFLGDMHYLSTWAAAMIARLRRKPFFFWTIGMHRPEAGLKLAIRNFWHRLPRHVLVYGAYARDLLIDSGIARERVTPIGNSLDYERQTSLFEQLDASGQPEGPVPRIVSIGRLTARRKLDRLIEAVALLASRGIAVTARIIGSGPEHERLQRLIHELELDSSVQLLGAVYEENTIAREVYSADLCVVPGIIGLGAIHAHSYGAPVITCGDWAIQAPEAEVIAPGATGAFCKWDDTQSVADEIENWLNARHPRPTVRAACRQRVANGWTPKRQRSLIERVLSRYLSTAGRSKTTIKT